MGATYSEKTYRRLQSVCLGLTILSLFVLFYVHQYVIDGDARNITQTLGRVASSYVEPESNPQAIIRAEDHCRFWDSSYCKAAEIRRTTFTSYFNMPLRVPAYIQQDPQYMDFQKAKQQLLKSTSTFVLFLNTKPSNEEYKAKAQSFEKEADELVGNIINSLYGLQQTATSRSDRANIPLLVVCYLIALAQFAILSIMRFDWGLQWTRKLG
ncbi:hypothetical protein FDG94_gp019 [Pseudomonas phage SM1]|uniref:Uncharacterized protein n=2 Tax=Samunavirus TaxID=2560221 RepID=A0A0U2SAH3_9CAUD|nr:hypothetical protein FDG94_gp019 [Pseudomonas phage SM1]UGC97134.1 hypothetical protein [Pseudomonas phage BHU-1]UGV19907.1 hypothetical protein [Pseudomonas phage Pa BHU-15]UIW13653.1 hypothetical protein [Pseudomonas phage Pa BHU-17]UVN14061.1 hypothetical protein FBPa45_0059 [Pseudomonas phage vB_PaeS_FBPa45]WDS62551.1 hypothetical protein UFRH6_125 [Pseudomonas phage UF_RH6]